MLAAQPRQRPDLIEVPSLVLNPNHPLYDLLHKKARNKVYWGGRGAAKSMGIAEALVRKAAYSSIEVLCCREVQNTLAESSHKVIVDTIKRLGLESWFDWNNSEVTSRAGARFIFRGLANGAKGLRSVQGIDICWVEEAQYVTAASWQALGPTMRKPGSEFWVSYNLISELDATHQRFVNIEDGSAKRTNSIVHKINYDSNPFLSDELREEMENDLAADYELYEHIWLGMAQKRSNAIIFNGRYRVIPFDRAEVISQAWMQRQFFGADFGFADDPATLVRSVITERREKDRNGVERDNVRKLWICDAVFGKHVEVDDMPAFYDRIPHHPPDSIRTPVARDWPIKGDASRPETISYIGRHGFPISAAEKWEGCVEDGIAHLRGFDEIIIHSDLKEMAAEAYMYRYKTDPRAVDERGQPLVLPIIVDKHNHGWDAVRYSLDGYIQRAGALGMWARLGRPQ